MKVSGPLSLSTLPRPGTASGGAESVGHRQGFIQPDRFFSSVWKEHVAQKWSLADVKVGFLHWFSRAESRGTGVPPTWILAGVGSVGCTLGPVVLSSKCLIMANGVSFKQVTAQKLPGIPAGH